MNEDKSARYHRLRRRADLLGTALTAAFLLWLLISGAGLYVREVASFLGGFSPRLRRAGDGRGLCDRCCRSSFSCSTLPPVALPGLSPRARVRPLEPDSRPVAAGPGQGGWRWASLLSALGASIVYAALRESPTWWWAISAGAARRSSWSASCSWRRSLLLPLFYSFKPLDRPALVDRLLALADRARTRIVGVYEWALSAHTKKANAALAGIGRTRRILLADTLLADYSDDEIEVILAHELSHHVHHDLWRGVALQTLLLFVSFYAAHLALTALGDSAGAARTRRSGRACRCCCWSAALCSLVFMPLANAAVARARAARRSVCARHDQSIGGVHLGDEAPVAAEPRRRTPVTARAVAVLLASADSRADRSRARWEQERV